MVDAIQIVAVFHVFFGVIWVGGSLYIDIAWVRPWKSTKTVGELRLWQRILRPTGMFLATSAVLVIATGLTYMFMKYGTDLVAIWANSSGMLILIALGLVIVAFLVAALGTSRLTGRLTRMSLPQDDDTLLSQEAQDLMSGIMRFSAFVTTLIVVVLVLMVLAATG